MQDSIGDRMKGNYEDRFRSSLPRRTNTIIRVDGKAFHSYTKGCQRPYDEALMEDMDLTAQYMCENIQGARIAYVQSDEISILLTDYTDIKTEAWFDGNLQKMASISASLATAKFNQARLARMSRESHPDPCWQMLTTDDIENTTPAHFDSRVFVIPEIEEVVNYFIWRQQDATRNSVQMAGQANFSHKQLQGKSCDEIQEMLFSQKGINWNDYPAGFRRGRCIQKYARKVPNPTVEDKMAFDTWIERSFWGVDKDIPIFTADRDYIKGCIPNE